MVVTEEYDIEARHFACHFHGRIFFISGRNNTAVASRMEQSDYDIGLLPGFDHTHPIAG
jgi:hypothetical protein